jgi:osmotically-inducible protein OsmY
MLRLACLALLAIAAAGQTSPVVKPASTTATPATKKPAADAEIEKKIRARFAASKISVNNFEVRVQGGVATITGRTDVLQHKGTATRLAKSSGAKQVNNRVEVSEAARQRAAANLKSGARRAQVKRSDVPSRK